MRHRKLVQAIPETIHPAPKYNVLSVKEGDSHSNTRGDILSPNLHPESEVTQDLKTVRNVPRFSLTTFLSLKTLKS